MIFDLTYLSFNFPIDLKIILDLIGTIAIIGALYYQRKELQEQRKQLISQTEEFKKTSEAQKKYAEAMEESNIIAERQIEINDINMLLDYLAYLNRKLVGKGGQAWLKQNKHKENMQIKIEGMIEKYTWAYGEEPTENSNRSEAAE